MRIEEKGRNEYGLKQVEVRLNLREAGTLFSSVPINGPETAAEVMKEMLKELDREMVCIVNLDTKNKPINFNVCSVGCLNGSVVTMNNVFKSAILSNAASIMLMHNHPSGSTEPSPEDDLITERVIRAGELMDISLTDHLIVGGVSGEVYSYLREKPWIWREVRNEYLFENKGNYVSEKKENYSMLYFNNFEEFRDFFAENVKKKLPDEYRDAEVKLNQVTRSNTVYTSMTVMREGQTVGVALNLDQFYNAYADGEPLNRLLDTAADILVNTHPDIDFSYDDLKDYENLKNRLFVRLHSREKDEQVRENVPHTDIGDGLFLTYHILVGRDGDSIKSAIITNEMLKTIGVPESTIASDSMISGISLFPPVLERLSARLQEIDPDFSMQENDRSRDLLVITNDTGVNGAAAFFYPGIADRASRLLGGDYYIIPSSIHELLLTSASPEKDYRELEEMVRQTNEMIVREEDQLGYELYYYDHSRKRILPAAEAVRTREHFVHEEQATYSAGLSPREKKAEFRKAAAEAFINLLHPDNPVKSFEWIKEWKDAAKPMSMRSGEEYRGINHAVLTMAAMAKGYSDPRWTTMNYLKFRKGMGVKKGERGVTIEYWLARDLTKKPGEYGSVIKTAEARNMILNGQRKEEDFTLVPRYSRVFNAEQCYGIPKMEIKQEEKKQISQAEMVSKISERMQVPIINDAVSRGCYYSVNKDEIHLPEPSAFISEYAYNASALHELAHASGAEKRLDRNISNEFGSDDYAFEELVAEMTSCFTAAELVPDERGMEEYTKLNAENHYRYVKGWAESLKKNPDCLVKAVKLAELSSDFLDLNADLLTLDEFNRRHARDKRAVLTEDNSIQIISTRHNTASVTFPMPPIETESPALTYNRSAHKHI